MDLATMRAKIPMAAMLHNFHRNFRYLDLLEPARRLLQRIHDRMAEIAPARQWVGEQADLRDGVGAGLRFHGTGHQALRHRQLLLESDVETGLVAGPTEEGHARRRIS